MSDMSDERLSPHLDGTGGGFGKYKGMTVREMSEQFERFAEDASMRSFTAVIRISREQVEARGQFGVNRVMLGICAFCTVAVFTGYVFANDRLRETLIRVGIACIGVTVALGFGLLSSRKHARVAMAQERAIRDVTMDALAKIASNPEFKPKPLDFTQRIYLTEVLKKTKRNDPAVVAVLEIPENG
jgi:hypothetical protein